MRILMIIDGLPGGGAEKVVLTLAASIQQQGHDVTLLSLRPICHYPLPEAITYEVIVDTCSNPWRKLTELSRRARALDKAIMAYEQQKGPFELIFSHLHKTDRIVKRSKQLAADKLWFCIHGVLSISYLRSRNALSRWWKKRKISKTYQQGNIVVVSAAIGEDLRSNLGINPGRLVVINNPFDTEAISQLANQPCELEGQEYLIHVGRFHPHKRHDRLLKAYAKTGLRAPLVLIGTGSDALMEEIKELAKALGIAERVHFLGFQANPYPYIKHAKLLILSSDSEGFGNVLVEALLCHTPVVSTHCPGGPEEILHKIGLLHCLSALNEDALSRLIQEVYDNPPIIRQEGLRVYEMEAICQQYLSLKDH